MNNNKNNVLAPVGCQLNEGGGHSCEVLKVTSLSQEGIFIQGNQIRAHVKEETILKDIVFFWEKRNCKLLILKTLLEFQNSENVFYACVCDRN